MKRISKLVIGATLAAMLATGNANGVQASTASAPEEPTSGSLTIDDATYPEISTYAKQKTSKVGGGTWKYRSYAPGGTRVCYSKYRHNTKRHSSTAALGKKVKRDVAGPAVETNAKVSYAIMYTCQVKWSNNP